MTQALIQINGVDGSNLDLPINTLVQLNNHNNGGETTFLWTILDQPPGTTDNLSSATIQNPTFTPKKEGTYLLRLVVNAGPSQVVNQAVAVVRQIKSRIRVPAAGESTEASTSQGWAAQPGVSDIHRLVDTIRADPGILVATAGAGGLAAANVVKMSGQATLKSGLPGQETVPSVTLALANVAANLDQPLAVVVQEVSGGAISNGSVLFVRRFGQVSGLSGSPSVGDPVYVSDAGGLALTPGTFTRKVGVVIASSAGVYAVFFDGGYTQSAPGVPFVFGNTATGNAPATEFLDPVGGGRASTANEAKVDFPSGGTIAKLRVRARTGPTGGSITITVRKNGADQALTATLAAAGTSANDLTHSFALSAGDSISVKAVSNAGVTAGAADLYVSFEFTRT